MTRTETIYHNDKIKVRKGEDRIVFVGKNHVAKLPRVEPKKFGKEALFLFKRVGWRYVLNDLKSYKSDQFGLRRWIFRGTHENIREHRLAKSYPDLIAPTKTVLGLCNIQPTLEPLKSTNSEVWGAFVGELGDQIHLLEHMMKEVSNLGADPDGQVLFVDGGSKAIDKLLPKRHSEIARALSTVAICEAQRNTTD